MTDSPVIGNLLDQLVGSGSKVADPWNQIALHRKNKHTVVIADLDLDVVDVPHITDDKPEQRNPARDLAYYSAHLIDQCASQVLMFRTSLDPWAHQGPAGIQTLVAITKRLQTLGTPLMLELTVGGSPRHEERQLNLLFGINVPNLGKLGFQWIAPTWVQVPSRASLDAIRRLLAAGKGVMLDMSWEMNQEAAFLAVLSLISSPVAPRPNSGVMPLGFCLPALWFVNMGDRLEEAIKATKTAVPWMVETTDPVEARRAMSVGVRINCPVIVAPGRQWSAAWKTVPDGADKWRRIALDQILDLNKAMEEPL